MDARAKGEDKEGRPTRERTAASAVTGLLRAAERVGFPVGSHASRDADPCIDCCPALVRRTLRVIGTKWAASILLVLSAASTPLRYAQLRRRIGAITPKELAKQLRALESAGLVGRKVYPTVPPRVEYWLTDLGRSTSPVMEALADLGARFGEFAGRDRGQDEAATE